MASVGAALFAAVALAQPNIETDRGCYLVGRAVQLTGQGFMPSHTYSVTVDGVLFGQRSTDPQGGLSIPVLPGGLPAGTAQHVDHIRVSDGTAGATTFFTVTRQAGAQVLASGGTPQTVEARFRVWGFSLGGAPRPVYVHYISPHGKQQARTFLGTTGGQCGDINTPRRKLFPFSVSAGPWTLQIDTKKAYVRHPDGPVGRIGVTVP